MAHYRKDFRVPRLRGLRALCTRRGLVLCLRIETDSPVFVATVNLAPPPPEPPRWHHPDETWSLP